MLPTLLMMTVLLAAPTERVDTVIAVSSGTRLDLANPSGEVVVRAWDRNEVRIRADLSSRQYLDIARSGAVLQVRLEATRRDREDADLQIDAPRWMDLTIKGNDVDVAVTGAGGEVAIETVGGDITVEGGVRLVTLRSVHGEIAVTGARGRIEARSVNEDIALTDIDGELEVETTNGQVELRGIRADVVRAFSMNDDVTYHGTIRDGGRYVFTSHNGDLEVTVPENANATVTVATFRGEFESDFPVRLTGTTGDKQFAFTLGSGSARIELESFNGEIQLIRP